MEKLRESGLMRQLIKDWIGPDVESRGDITKVTLGPGQESIFDENKILIFNITYSTILFVK